MRLPQLLQLAAAVVIFGACEPPAYVTPPEIVARNDQRKAEAQERETERQEEAARRRAELQSARDAEVARIAEEAYRRKHAAEPFLKFCREQDGSRRTKLAELEPTVTAVLQRREAAAATRAADESWVREHCIWENDPRYALEAKRRASANKKVAHYEINERFVGYSRSAPICPRDASKAQLAVAADIANELVSDGRLVIKNSDLTQAEASAIVEHKNLSEQLQFCGDLASGRVVIEPDGSRSVVREKGVRHSGTASPTPPGAALGEAPQQDPKPGF